MYIYHVTLPVWLSIHSVDERMESTEYNQTPSLPESTISFGMDGRTQEVAERTPTAADSATLNIIEYMHITTNITRWVSMRK